MSQRVIRDTSILCAHLLTAPPASPSHFIDSFNKRYRSSGDSVGSTEQVHLQNSNCSSGADTLALSVVWLVLTNS